MNSYVFEVGNANPRKVWNSQQFRHIITYNWRYYHVVVWATEPPLTVMVNETEGRAREPIFIFASTQGDATVEDYCLTEIHQ